MKNAKIPIDVFVSVVDNFGDMGYACESIAAFSRDYPGIFRFFVYTDDCQKVWFFFKINGVTDDVKIFDKKNYQKTADLALSFLDADFPKNSYKKIAHVDYLSFDQKWLKNNFSEHIFSSKNHEIRHFIPSIMDSGAGTFPKMKRFSRQDIAKKFWVRLDRRWFSIFCYADTLKKWDFSGLPLDVEILIFGHSNTDFSQKIPHSVSFLPFMSAAEMYSFFAYSVAIITRGEASFLQTISLGIPFFWDIYHEKWGFPFEQELQFLDFMKKPSDYNCAQKKIYREKNLPIGDYLEILLKETGNFRQFPAKNIVENLKNYFFFSEPLRSIF